MRGLLGVTKAGSPRSSRAPPARAGGANSAGRTQGGMLPGWINIARRSGSRPSVDQWALSPIQPSTSHRQRQVAIPFGTLPSPARPRRPHLSTTLPPARPTHPQFRRITPHPFFPSRRHSPILKRPLHRVDGVTLLIRPPQSPSAGDTACTHIWKQTAVPPA